MYLNKKNIIIEFLNEVIKIIDKDTEFYSHNINFDGMLIIETLTKKKIRFEWFIRDLNIYWIKIYFVNMIITLRCSYKIIPLSIEKIGEIIGIKKKIFPYKFSSYKNLYYIGDYPDIKYFDNVSIEDYEKFTISKEFDFKKVSIEYCQNDLLILEDVLINIFNIINSYSKNIIRYSYSFSSIAYKLFSKKYDTFRICEKKIKIREYEYIKKSYYGGRCEVFGNPSDEEIIHHFDFSGMYAQCMKNRFPTGRPIFKTDSLNIKEIGLHSVKVFSDSEYPILPSHYKEKLFFLNGYIIGVFTHIELLFFIENGGKIIDHYSSYVYPSEENVFIEYVEEFSKIRSKGKYYNFFGKSMHNGLYGSFALNVDNEETVIVYNEDELNTYLSNTMVKSWKKINNCIIIKIAKNSMSKKFLDKRNNWSEEISRNLIYASYISSYARIKLYRGILEILKNKGRIYYCDTDSFFAGFKKSYLNECMGEIKWTEIYDDAVFISPKFYYLKIKEKEKVKSKGVRNDNEHTFDIIKKNFYDNKEEIIFKNQLTFYKKDYILLQKYGEKNISINGYDKRIFIENKKKTTPVYSNTY